MLTQQRSTAASVSRVGTSPAQAITTSGSLPRSLLAHSQMPIPAVQCLMPASMSSHCGAGLLAGDDDVHVVAAAQAVVGDGQQGVGVGRQVDADHVGFLVDDDVEKAGILMGETVVVLAPDVGREKVVERGDGPAPRDFAADSATWRAD